MDFQSSHTLKAPTNTKASGKDLQDSTEHVTSWPPVFRLDAAKVCHSVSKCSKSSEKGRDLILELAGVAVARAGPHIHVNKLFAILN